MLLCPRALAVIHHLLMLNPLVFLFDTDRLRKPELAEMAQEGIRGGITGRNVWKLQFNLSFRSWKFMKMRLSLIPALGLNGDSLIGVCSLFRVTCDEDCDTSIQ